MKVFVTGGTGFIGAAVVRQLRARGDDVVALVRTPAKGAPLQELGCTLMRGDLSDEAAIRAVVEDCDAVIHAAAVYEIGLPTGRRQAMREANVGGTERVLGAAREAGVGKVVYVSTVNAFGNTHGRIVDESYENPADSFTSEYERTKWEAHRIAELLIGEGLPCVIAQPGGVYGPGDTSSIGRLINQFLDGKMPLIPFPELGFSMTYVEDAAAGILLALDRGEVGETYVLSGPLTTVREMIGVVAAETGRKAPRFGMPTGVFRALTPIGPLVGKMIGQPPNLREIISSAAGVTFWAGHRKATRELGYEPRGLEDGIRATLAAEGKLPAGAA